MLGLFKKREKRKGSKFLLTSWYFPRHYTKHFTHISAFKPPKNTSKCSPWDTILRILLEMLRRQHVRWEVIVTIVCLRIEPHGNAETKTGRVVLSPTNISLHLWVLCNRNRTLLRVHLLMFPLLAVLCPHLYLPLPDIYSKDMKTRIQKTYVYLYVYCSIIYDNQDMEAT